jgi:hypothetical protein
MGCERPFVFVKLSQPHAYQGGLYLEHTDEDDWTFHIMKGSHLFIDEFYETHKKAAFRSNLNKYHHMKDEDIEWFESKGCKTYGIFDFIKLTP